MRNQFVVFGVLIAVGGLLAYVQILQRAQRLLSPDQLYALAQREVGPWWQGFVPVAPVLPAYLLVPFFPDRQAYIAVPALLLAFVLEVRFFLHAAKRKQDIGLPEAFVAARKKAHAILAFALIAGIGIGWIGMGVWHV